LDKNVFSLIFFIIFMKNQKYFKKTSKEKKSSHFSHISIPRHLQSSPD